jgi:SagB-type dehydrogenase family enzyme
MTDDFKYFLKNTVRKTIDKNQTDCFKGLPIPPIEKPCPVDAVKIDLPNKDSWQKYVNNNSVEQAITERKSRRKYSMQKLTLHELSFLLWATQGIRGTPTASNAYRTVPSAGCRHAIETYLTVFNVVGLEKGIYRYLPLTHQLVIETNHIDSCVNNLDSLEQLVIAATSGQTFVGKGAVTFFWAAIPYRTEWKYSLAAYKDIALDVGHICQNLYIACEAIDAGTCAVAAYDQELADSLLGLDGKDEFVIYAAPVGKTTI